jgi:hypothetical protein
MAEEYGEHPTEAVRRMLWVLGALPAAFPDDVPSALNRGSGGAEPEGAERGDPQRGRGGRLCHGRLLGLEGAEVAHPGPAVRPASVLMISRQRPAWGSPTR